MISNKRKLSESRDREIPIFLENEEIDEIENNISGSDERTVKIEVMSDS